MARLYANPTPKGADQMAGDDIPKAAMDGARGQLEALRRGTVRIFTEEALLDKLARSADARQPLRVKLGLDPTSPDIHLGHTVQLSKMRQFQDLGHTAVLIVGDYTARIGDPSGQDHTRPVLSDDQIRSNAQTYMDQAGRVLRTDRQFEIRSNSEWLAKLTFADTLRLAARMTVARMLERDSFQARYKAGDPIGVHEFLYPLMQAYDSVAVRADVELGGTDQTFNCLAGRELMRDYGLQAQVVITMPLLVGLDGAEKMSKSKGNYIGVTEPAGEMFGKVMSIPDALMENYWTLLTARPVAEVQRLLCEMHPREAKDLLARDIVTRYWGAEEAAAASAEFRRVFAENQEPGEIPELRLVGAAFPLPDHTMGLAELIVRAGFARSNSDAMRLIKQGAVSLNDQKIDNPQAFVAVRTGQVLKVGKRRWARLAVK